MTQSARATLRVLLQHLDDTEFAATCERVDRYIRLAAAVSLNSTPISDTSLTDSQTRVSVNVGEVDPTRTFKNIG